jgi:hypothetical protein
VDPDAGAADDAAGANGENCEPPVGCPPNDAAKLAMDWKIFRVQIAMVFGPRTPRP